MIPLSSVNCGPISFRSTGIANIAPILTAKYDVGEVLSDEPRSVVPQFMRQKVEILQRELSKFPQYEPKTNHYFHGGMYCREVFRHKGVLVVGKVHKKEHFYIIVSGTVQITDGTGEVHEVTGPHLFLSKPGTKRAVYAVTDALCMTFHATETTTLDAAESEMVEEDPTSMYDVGNKVKLKQIEVLS